MSNGFRALKRAGTCVPCQSNSGAHRFTQRLAQPYALHYEELCAKQKYATVDFC